MQPPLPVLVAGGFLVAVVRARLSDPADLGSRLGGSYEQRDYRTGHGEDFDGDGIGDQTGPNSVDMSDGSYGTDDVDETRRKTWNDSGVE
ncbi:hypothetical protein [Haloarchaeobius sp. DFWS5]|uniref:hypothetical protein n=1 Tax=Haloarchaeobius sp. DFWS5 TaxID=3446114 RepID=UPI003EB8684B